MKNDLPHPTSNINNNRRSIAGLVAILASIPTLPDTGGSIKENQMSEERKDLKFVLEIMHAEYELTGDKWYVDMAKKVSQKLKEKYSGHKEKYESR